MAALSLTDADLLDLGIGLKSLSEIDAGVRAKHIAAAVARVEGVVAQQFSSVSTWSMDLVEAAAVLAAYSLLTRRGYGPDKGANASIKERRDAAEAFLERLRKGETSPGGAFVGTRVVRWHVASEPRTPVSRARRGCR